MGRHQDGHQDGLDGGDYAFLGLIAVAIGYKLNEIIQLLEQILEKM